MKGLRAILVPAMTILGVLIGSDALVAKEASARFILMILSLHRSI